MGWRHLIFAAVLVAPLASQAQDWRSARDQSRTQPDETENRVHIYQDRPRSYVGANLAHAMLEVDGFDEDVTLTAVNARLGAMTSDHFGMEVRFGIGGDKHTLRNKYDPRDKLDQSIDYLGGLYLTSRAAFMSLPYDLGRAYAQGYLGIGTGQIESSLRECDLSGCSETSNRNSETDFSYGVALGVQPVPEISLALEYMHYFSTDDVDLNTLEAGIMYHF